MENPEGARTRTVEASENGERLDTAVAALADVTRSAAARLIGDGAVTVNGQVHDKNYRLRAGDVLTVQPPQVQEATAVAQALPLDVIYEDADLIVINKPVGHGGASRRGKSGRDAGQRAPVALRGEPLRRWRGHPTRHCAPD